MLSVLSTIVAVWCVFAALKAVSYTEGIQRTATAYAADQADVVHTTATVTSLSFHKKKIGGSTSAEVAWDGGKGSDYIALSDSEDLRSQEPVGHPLPVAVWRGHVMRFEVGGEWHDTDEEPSAALGDGLVLVCVFTVGAAVFGRIGAHGWLAARVDFERFLVGDVLVLAFVVATVFVALTSTSTSQLTPLTYLVSATPAALLVSVLVLPAVPWVRAPRRRP